MKTFPILYKKTSTNAQQQWQIMVENDYFYTISGQVGGKLVQSKPNKCIAKNIGKKNETSQQEQAFLEAEAKWKKKIKENYKEDINKIDEIGFFKPMLAKQFEDYKDKIKYPVAVQDKLNGIRCIVTLKGAFSRKGEEFYCIDHIKNALIPLFKKYPNLILDGELFNPIYKNQLNQIAKLVSVNRKIKDISKEDIENSEKIVQYHIYDGVGFTYNKANISKDSTYFSRHTALNFIIDNIKYISLLQYELVESYDKVKSLLQKAKDNNSEGIIIRLLNSPYQNKRSKFLLKLKNFSNTEFKILDLKEGVGNWADCVKIVTCKLNKTATDGRTEFDSNIKGTREELAELWKNKDKYIGQLATIEYQEMSEYGIPLIPYTKLPFRNYE